MERRGRPLSLPTERKDLVVAFFFFFLFFYFFLSFFESIWATHWAPSAVRAAKRTEAAEAELHAGRVDRWA